MITDRWHDNNNNKRICIAPSGLNFRVAEARQCAAERRGERKLGRMSRRYRQLLGKVYFKKEECL